MSTVTVSAADVALVFPAMSVAVDVRACAPSARVVVVMDQSPDPSAVAVPTAPSTSDVSAMELPASAVPETVGVLTLVMSSVSSVPESLAAARSAALGAAGGVVSMVNSLPVPSKAALPATSVAVAVTSWTPSARSVSTLSARLQVVPLLVAETVCVSTTIEIVALLSSTVPVSAGVASLVSSVSTETVGAVVSTVTVRDAEAALTFPAMSMLVAVSTWTPSDNGSAATTQTPFPAVVVVATVASRVEDKLIEKPGSANPRIVGLTVFVMSSVLEDPESLAATKSTELGMPGAVVSTPTRSGADAILGPLPNWSVC